MATHDVEITFDGTQFHYHESGHDATHIKHCHKRETIRWKLVGYGARLEIKFNKDGNPFIPPTSDFTAPTGQWTNPGKFNDSHRSSYHYSVVALDANGVPHQEDPTIEFDDGTDDEDRVRVFRLDDETLAKLGTAAEAAFDGLRAKLENTTKLKRDPTAFFFPGGINNIQVSATVPLGLSSLTVTVGVSGPDGTQAEVRSSSAEKKNK